MAVVWCSCEAEFNSDNSTLEENTYCGLDSTFRYIENVLIIFTFVNSICPSQFQIKYIRESSICDSYLDVLLVIDVNGKLTTENYNKQDYFRF